MVDIFQHSSTEWCFMVVDFSLVTNFESADVVSVLLPNSSRSLFQSCIYSPESFGVSTDVSAIKDSIKFNISEFKLGRCLRKRYKSLLGSTFSSLISTCEVLQMAEFQKCGEVSFFMSCTKTFDLVKMKLMNVCVTNKHCNVLLYYNLGNSRCSISHEQRILSVNRLYFAVKIHCM